MVEKTYREPLNKFLELGRPTVYDADKWTDYVSDYKLTDDHIPDLLRLLADYVQPVGEDDDFDESKASNWTAIHVWRALGQLKAETAIQALIDAMMLDEWEEWGTDDIPQAIALMGEPAIAPLKAELAKRADSHDKHPVLLQSSLERIGKRHETLRDQVVDIFIEQLEKAEANDPALNGFMIGALTDWKVEKALPVIEKAFETNHVDTGIMGDWEEVQVEFGLKTVDEIDAAAKKAQRRATMMRQMGADTLDLGDLSSPSTSKKTSADKKKKAKRKQAKKSQKQNRKKKKKKK